jgi:transglutaminase-like putative cysteine protease
VNPAPGAGRAGEPGARALRWTTAAFVATVALHVDRLPVWVTASVLLLGSWRLLAGTGRVPMVPAWARVTLGAVLLLAVIARFSTISGLSAGTALLAAMGALKLTETRERRDHYVVVGVALFLIVAACLDRQDLLHAPLYAGATWLVCAALAVAGTPSSAISAGDAWRLSGRALALALPIAAATFLLFPRVQGQIWALPGSGGAVTGLSNEMSPGGISQLSESFEPAFRARFAGPVPPPRDLYWRGPVLHSFDGYTWRREPRGFQRVPRIENLGVAYRHRVMLEPHQRNWWFALDLPSAAPSTSVFLTSEYQLVVAEPVTQPTSYDVTSYARVRFTGPLSPTARRQTLQLPTGRNPRSTALARQLRAQASGEEAFVDAVLGLFRTGGFVYTLTPPRLDLDSVDDFVFNTRAGFCGHFASAFVSMMRAGGLPGRVVTGYHGGEWNPIGEYYIVRQSDAHAWAEVWLEGRGWTRVDPTGVVSPERLNRGFFASMPGAASRTERILREIDWISGLRLRWDSVNTWWKDRVLDFDLRAQLALLERLGAPAPRVAWLGWLLAGALALWLGVVALLVGRGARRDRGDALARAYRGLCSRLATAGLPRAAHEGPLDYARRIGTSRPDLDRDVTPLLRRYAALRFGPASVDERERLTSELRAQRVDASPRAGA